MSYQRVTVDLSEYPDLVYINLGMRPLNPRGLWSVVRYGLAIRRAMQEKPDGLLRHESLIYLVNYMPHFGMRQYWRDFDSLELWTRYSEHGKWWGKMARSTGGTMIWHESFAMQGGVDAIYASHTRIPQTGFMTFAPVIPAQGAGYSARQRLNVAGEETAPRPIKQ